MKEFFRGTKFRPVSRELVAKCNEIVEDYQSQGLRLTLRQLYYQLVTKNIIVNSERSYQNLSALVSNGRLAGKVDWSAIEDRVRMPRKAGEFDNLRDLMLAAVYSYRLPRWKGQLVYTELWVEKDALAGVLEPLAREYHATLMVNRGYSSQSAMYEAAKRYLANRKTTVNLKGCPKCRRELGEDALRLELSAEARVATKGLSEKKRDAWLKEHEEEAKPVAYWECQNMNCEWEGPDAETKPTARVTRKLKLFYLGDHDPSGEDMVRDIADRLKMFKVPDLEVRKVGLTIAQVKKYSPPPNPAKISDPRAADYIKKYGPHSWEVDALPPNVLRGLIKAAFEGVIDLPLMDAIKAKEESHKKHLLRVTDEIMKSDGESEDDDPDPEVPDADDEDLEEEDADEDDEDA